MKPLLERYMTPDPITIAPSATLASAHALMREYAVRHLPVVDADRVIGLVSIRDLHLLEMFPHVDLATTTVDAAMSTEVVTAMPSDTIASAAAIMAERKLGCLVITKNERVVGIFTAVDALRLLATTVA